MRHNPELFSGPLEDLAAKVLAGERLNRTDGIRLAESDDLLTLGRLADHARKNLAGNEVYFINNVHINYTNICRNLCSFCAFGRPAEGKSAYVLSIGQIAAKAEEAKKFSPSEVHIVGGSTHHSRSVITLRCLQLRGRFCRRHIFRPSTPLKSLLSAKYQG